MHQGDPEPARAVVPQAIGRALACLLLYAAAPAFPDKGAVIAYLDWTAKGDQLARTWTAAEQCTLRRLQKHTPAPRAFPFLTPAAAVEESAT